MSSEMKIVMDFIKEAEKAIGRLPLTVRMIAITAFVEKLSKVEASNEEIVILTISNPKTNMRFTERLLIVEK